MITPSQLLMPTNEFLIDLKKLFIAWCHRRGTTPTKRQARKWLARNNLR